MSSPSEKMTRFKTKCRPLKVKAKAKAAAFLSAIKIAVKAADYIANVTQVTKLQVVTGVACKIIECCETMRDNKEQAEELANVVRDVVATLDGVANRPHLGDEDEQLKKDAAPLAKALYTIEKSMSKIAGAKKWKKLCNVGSDAKTIKDCSEKLRTALNIFQTKNGVALRAELAHVSAVFGAIGHDVTILPVVHEHVERLDQRLAVIEGCIVTFTANTQVTMNPRTGANATNDSVSYHLDDRVGKTDEATPRTLVLRTKAMILHTQAMS